MSFCASCIRPITGPTRILDGCVICADCADGEIDATTPEYRQRGYEPTGGHGASLQRAIAAAHDRIVPERVRRLEAAVALEIPAAAVLEPTHKYGAKWREIPPDPKAPVRRKTR